MKSQIISKMFLMVFVVLALVSCDKDKDEVKDLTADEAKVELRNATQQISNNMEQMMTTPAMQSLNFLSVLMGEEGYKTSFKQMLQQPGKLHLAKVKQVFLPAGTKSVGEIEGFGYYEYDYDMDDFVLVEAAEDMLKLAYPADETAYNGQQNNAELTVSNIETVTIVYTETYWDDFYEQWVTETYEEEFPVKLDATQKVDGTTLMSASYVSTLDETGAPTSFNITMNMLPYSFTASLTGTGNNYKTVLSFKENNATLMGYDLTLEYTSDMESVNKLSGNYIIDPLKLEGYMNYDAIDTHMINAEETGNYDLNYLNGQMELELIHMGQNAKLGDVKFVMYTDPEYGESFPSLAVVYADGTYEWLESILEVEMKYSRLRK